MSGFDDDLIPKEFRDLPADLQSRIPRAMRDMGVARSVILPLRREGDHLIFPKVDRVTLVRSIVTAPALHGIYMVRTPRSVRGELQVIPDWTPVGHLTPDALFRGSLTIARLDVALRQVLDVIERRNTDNHLEFEGSVICEQVENL